MKRNLLYVDDELDNIVVFEAAFDESFNILTAANGDEALRLLEQHPVPVVVADQRMPNMTGVQLFEIIRQESPQTKRVLLTGYTDADAMTAAINQGQVFHYIRKPWERGFLFSVLVRAFEAYDLEMANLALTDRMISSERCALLGQVTARIAHEIGNQLCILPLLEMIEENYSHDRDLMDVARFARQTHERLVGLVQEVKDFMQFEQQSFSTCPLHLADVVREIVSFLRFDQSISWDRIRIDVRDNPVVSVNKAKLQQVLVNLFKNASDAISDTLDGTIVLCVASEGDQAVVAVSDNGCGIPDELQPRVWNPFFTTKLGGNGLGLDISRRLIEAHGGTIAFQSDPGKGTTFVVRLPILAQPHEAGAQAGDLLTGPVPQFRS